MIGFGPLCPDKAPRIGIGPLVAQDVDEYAVSSFGMQPINRGVKNLFVIHPPLLCPGRPVVLMDMAPGGPM